jgi:hypothetical protein
MAQYDPQRSRSRHRSGDDEGPAPVDALLTPHPTEPAPPVDAPAPLAEPTPPRLLEPVPPTAPPARSSFGVVAALVAVLVATLLLVRAVARRRRRGA